MENIDLYDIDRKNLGIKLERGSKLPKDCYRAVTYLLNE